MIVRILMIVLFLTITSCTEEKSNEANESKPKTSSTKNEQIEKTSEQIMDEIDELVRSVDVYYAEFFIDPCLEYMDNEVAANLSYKNKIIKIRGGCIQSIREDPEGFPYLVIGSNKFKTKVNCFFAKRHKYKLAKLSKGEPVIITGMCLGLDSKSIYSLYGCKLKKVDSTE